MELVKESGDLKIYKKRNGRHCVKKGSKYINGEEKQKLLLSENLIKLSKPNPNKGKEEAAAEEPAAAE